MGGEGGEGQRATHTKRAIRTAAAAQFLISQRLNKKKRPALGQLSANPINRPRALEPSTSTHTKCALPSLGLLLGLMREGGSRGDTSPTQPATTAPQQHWQEWQQKQPTNPKQATSQPPHPAIESSFAVAVVSCPASNAFLVCYWGPFPLISSLRTFDPDLARPATAASRSGKWRAQAATTPTPTTHKFLTPLGSFLAQKDDRCGRGHHHHIQGFWGLTHNVSSREIGNFVYSAIFGFNVEFDAVRLLLGKEEVGAFDLEKRFE